MLTHYNADKGTHWGRLSTGQSSSIIKTLHVHTLCLNNSISKRNGKRNKDTFIWGNQQRVIINFLLNEPVSSKNAKYVGQDHIKVKTNFIKDS